jgi:hypothetical protein
LINTEIYFILTEIRGSVLTNSDIVEKTHVTESTETIEIVGRAEDHLRASRRHLFSMNTKTNLKTAQKRYRGMAPLLTTGATIPVDGGLPDATPR